MGFFSSWIQARNLHVCLSELGPEYFGRKINAYGWVKNIRKHKSVSFVDIDDGSVHNPIQVISIMNLPKELHVGASIQVEGRLVDSRAGFDIEAESIEVIGKCDAKNYLIQNTSLTTSKLRSLPIFKLRTKLHSDLVKLRSCWNERMRIFLQNSKFIEIHTPCINFSDSEGGAENFEIQDGKKFFGKPAYLTVSGQLHLEISAHSFARTFTYGPVFRAEKHSTSRHLAEFYMLEAEIAFLDSLDTLMDFTELLIKKTIESVATNHSSLIKKHILDLVLESPFARLKYDEALLLLNTKSDLPKLQWGDSLSGSHEKYLVENIVGRPVFVRDYPAPIKAFYMKTNSSNEDVGQWERTSVESFDLLFPHVCEVAGGSLRETDYDKLLKSISFHGLDPEDYKWYTDLRKFGSAAHGGFGLGVDRVIQYLTQQSSIKDTVFVARYRDNNVSPRRVMKDIELRDAFLNFCKEQEKPTDKSFLIMYPAVDHSALARVINTLITEGAIEISYGLNGLTYKVIPSSELSKGLMGDELIIFKCVEMAGNKGIWTRDLKIKTNLHQTVITKSLKTLENKKLIKAVRPVKNSTRKIYMVFNLEPSTEITGGPWFNENELDLDFIEEMSHVCYRFICSKSFLSETDAIYPSDYAGYPSTEAIYDFVVSSRVTSADLSIEDIQSLLDRLQYDGLIQKVAVNTPSSRIVDDDEDENIYVYKATKSFIDNGSAICSVPCGTCTIISKCSSQGKISPDSCQYYEDWSI